MSWTTPRTWATSEVVTASHMNTHVRDNTSFLYNAPACRVYQAGSGQSISNNTQTAVTFDSERYDSTGTMHSTSSQTSRITIPEAGVYSVGGGFIFTADANNLRGIGLRVGGSNYIAQWIINAPASGDCYMTISTSWKFAATNYVELMAFQTRGSSLSLFGSSASNSCEFHATWVAAG